jgi:MFS transporter, putative metabolite:H+ symporter
MTEINKSRLFLASCIALVTTSMTFAIRAGMLGELGKQFNLTNAELGWINSMAFLGFPLATMIGGWLCDVVGMGRLLILAFITHMLGIILTIAATGFWTLFLSTFFIGFANGTVEAACNPMITAMFPDKKTEMLNRFHVWFPGGLVIGGLLSYFMDNAHLDWTVKVSIILIPAFIYGVLFLNQTFPKTERVSSGISAGEMLKACVSPLYLFMVACMLLTATTELGTNQWVSTILKNVGAHPILLLVWINLIMAVGRLFAGQALHALEPTGILLGSSVLAVVGLLWLSNTSGMMSFGAAGIFAMGCCFFWPTMLGFVAENIPKSGALGMSLIGGAGMFAVSIFQPVLGSMYDSNLVAAKADPATNATQTAIDLAAGAHTLQSVVILPIILVFAFFGLRMYMSNQAKAAH